MPSDLVRPAVEEPLRRVVALRLGQAVGVLLRRDLLPMGKVEGDFDERGIGDVHLLVQFSSPQR